MCWKKISEWFKPVDSLPDYTNQTVASIVVGDYPGTANDLDGPPYDQIDFENMVVSQWPQFVFRKFKDSAATTTRFLSELKTIVARMKAGDLLLFIMDTCFSESNTRKIAPKNTLNIRVFHNPKYPKHKSRTNKVLSPTNGLRYVAMSACLDRETASDAVFDGRPGGAFHYALIKTAEKGITYRQWDYRAGLLLKQLGFEQHCTIEGPDDLIDRKIFEGTVYVIEISSHGSHYYDENGDEPDRQDEGPYLYDGFLLDDKIAEVLKDLPN